MATRTPAFRSSRSRQLRARQPGVGIYLYPAQHGFCNSDRPDRFDEAACKKASARTLDFFDKHLK